MVTFAIIPLNHHSINNFELIWNLCINQILPACSELPLPLHASNCKGKVLTHVDYNLSLRGSIPAWKMAKWAMFLNGQLILLQNIIKIGEPPIFTSFLTFAKISTGMQLYKQYYPKLKYFLFSWYLNVVLIFYDKKW